MFKGKKENYPFSVCRPFVDTRIGKKLISFLLFATQIHINTHCVIKKTKYNDFFFFIYEGVEDINIKVLQMIQQEHIKVNCSSCFRFRVLILTVCFSITVQCPSGEI